MAGTVLVTVGSTKFDELIRAMDNKQIAGALVAKGYDRLILQVGSGSYAPSCLLPNGQSTNMLPNGIKVEAFDYVPSLAQYMSSAALIISHAGSGSVFEALRLRKPLIAVPNAILMANHQLELADYLAEMGHLVSAEPANLLEAIQTLDTAKLVPYQKGSPKGIVAAIDELLGFS